jgi:pantetheine-phosphate adenylyltransferase
MNATKAIYAFSGDPITYGHIHIISRAAKIFNELIVGIGINPSKKYLFSIEERVEMAKNSLHKFENVEVVAFSGLLVDYAFENNIPVIIRGLRNSEDFNMELLLHQIGESQKINIETIFFPTGQNMGHISSSAAKALQLEQGFVFEYVPLNVKQRLEEKLSGQFIIGITGEIASGKSYLSNQLVTLGKKEGVPVHLIDIDKIAHQILESLTQPLYKELRDILILNFGDIIKNTDGYIDRKQLGKILFQSPEKLKQFNDLIQSPLLLRLRRELYGKKGIILLDGALIAESKMTYLCNNNIILVNTKKNLQLSRLKKRSYSAVQIHQRVNSQYSYEVKRQYIEKTIEVDEYGKIFLFENFETENEAAIRQLFDRLVGAATAILSH